MHTPLKVFGMCSPFWDNNGAVVNMDFQFTVATTTASEVMTIPCQNVGVFDATIDWGDGSAAVPVTAYNDANLSHTYADAGSYQITVSGTFPNVYFGGDSTMAAKVTSVDNLGKVGWVSMYRAFYICSNMTTFTVGDTDTSNVTTFTGFLTNCTALTSFDSASIQVTSVATRIDSFFYGCSGITSAPDVSGWDVSSVTYFSYTFYAMGITSPPDVSGWDVGSATTMQNMFASSINLTTPPDTSAWVTPNLTNAAGLFYKLTALTSPPDIAFLAAAPITTLYTTFTYMPAAVAAELPLDTLNVSAVTTMTNMLYSSGLSTSRYDATLVAWDAQTLQSSVTAHFGSSTYTIGSAADTARANLINNDLWTITDGGGV